VILRRNGRFITTVAQSITLAQPWTVVAFIAGDQTARYLKLWKRRQKTLDALSLKVNNTTFSGDGKITKVELHVSADRRERKTMVRWSGIGELQRTVKVEVA
jgi:hypothetical protein